MTIPDESYYDQLATDVKIHRSWGVSFWVQVIDSPYQDRILTFQIGRHSHAFLFLKDKRVTWTLSYLDGSVNQTTDALETSRYQSYHSIQVTYSARLERAIIYVDGEVQREDFWKLEPLEIDSIFPALNNALRYGGLYWTQHTITTSEASFFHEDYKDSFPTEPVFVLRLPFAVIIATICLIALGKAWSICYKSDPPDYFGIIGIGFGVLDFTCDYQLAYRLYSIQDDLWYFVVGFSCLAYVANLIFLIKWWRAKVVQDNVLSHWLNKYRRWTLFLIVLAGSHTTILRFAYVRLSPKMFAQYFRMPISLEQKKAINRGKFITTVFEDIPLLILQTILLNSGIEKEDANTSLAVSIALLTSIIAIVQTAVEFIASPHSLKYLKHQWVQFSYPNFDIGLRQNSIRSRFSKLFRGTTTDVIVCDLRKNHYRLLFQYSHKENTLGQQVDIHDKILECLAKYFEPGVSSLVFESPPKFRKVVNDLCELSHDLGGEHGGSLDISNGSDISLRLPDVDQDVIKEIMERTRSDGIISMDTLKKLKLALDKTFQRETLDEARKQTRLSITGIMSRHGTDHSEKTLSGISPNTSELWSEQSIRDLPHTLRLLNKASSVHSSTQITDVSPSPLPHFIDSGASYLETNSMIEMAGVENIVYTDEPSLSESNNLVGSRIWEPGLKKNYTEECAKSDVGGEAIDGSVNTHTKRSPAAGSNKATELPTSANISCTHDG